VEARHAESVVVPANRASWPDLEAIVGGRGSAHRCQCQRYKLRPGEAFAKFPVSERADRWRRQTNCDVATAEQTSGLVAYLDGEPVGWCAIEPRSNYPSLIRSGRIPWAGRNEDRDDPSVWAVTCVFIRAGRRRRGIGTALVGAAVEFAAQRGARAVEGYPITTTNVIDEELHVGTVGMFADAGLVEVSRPTLRRVVMRQDF